ncbi:Lipase_3 domain-containing protein/Lipase3_N domain-containing protein [Cephalotus follicularis]|uniref:Lipase_3 domain-containing protein/Lipase3_N domain-containing protein n=1 Tax=Cephalotus follicularis TaxID=3775 RepID=A0A1Q3DHU5_CEPFO|nr:Lipase_3 domain-containing protein/Lipase3_N domain-containing protein [Cephalotus follicularis]
MSIVCGIPILESVYCLACARWVWQKCLYTAGHESENWGLATAEEFEYVPHLCRLILAVYEDDLCNPIWDPPGGYGINPDWVILKKDYEETRGRVTPYMIYLDHDNADIVLAVRGLNLAKESDYAVLLDNKLGQTKFNGGYVHNGLLKAAVWLFEAECGVLRELIERNPNYRLTFAGHSLGAGVVALLVMVAVQNRDKLGNIERNRVRCFAMAPVRCVSLNLAVRYADIINSVVLQDDFLPRTTAALEDVFKSLFCLPCLLCVMCLKETFTLEEKKLKDPRRLYAPGRLYHIVERKPLRIGRFPPVVRTAVPVDGRFEHIVLSTNATADHAIVWIERESQRALDLMLEKDRSMEIPSKQKMDRQESLVREHSEEYRAALQRAVALDIPLAFSPSSYGTFRDVEEGETSGKSSGEVSSSSTKKRRESWDDLAERLFNTDEAGDMVYKRSVS